VFHEVVINALQSRHYLSHGKDLFGSVGPFEITHPGCRVLLGLDISLRTGKEESQLSFVHVFVAKHNVDSHFEGEQKLVSFEKRPADILIERLCKVVIECLYSDAFSLALSR